MHREYCNSFNKTVSIFQPLEEMEELKTQLLAKKCWASHSGSEWTMNISIHCHQMYTFKEWRNWIQTEVWNFNLQVTVNLNELNFSFLSLQVLLEVHCIKSKVKCWVGKPNTLKQGFDVEEVCVSGRIYLGNQYYTLKPLMYLTTSICKHIIMWWNPGTVDQSSAGWCPWWCVFVLPRKCNGLRTTDTLRTEKKIVLMPDCFI